MQNTLLDILILGLLVLLFGVIYRKRATARLRFWIAGWLFVMFHFVLLLLNPQTALWLNMDYAFCMNGLVLGGVCFILACSAYSLSKKQLWLLGLAISAPTLVYVFLAFFGFAKVWPLTVLSVGGETLVLWILYRFCRKSNFVLAVNTLAAVVCGSWLLIMIHTGDAVDGVYAILTQLFLGNAVLYWKDFGRNSAGVLVASLGLVAWAAVFPVSLMTDHFFPQFPLSTELWNIPKYFVEFGMILTLMENQIYSASWQTEQYRLLFDSNPHAMFIYDARTLGFLRVNDAALTQYGYEREEFLRMNVCDLYDLAVLPEVEQLLTDPEGAIRNSGPWTQKRKDGSHFQVEMSSRAIEFLACPAFLSMAQDVTERQRLHDQLVHRAHHDSLTSLPNRFLLEQRMLHTLENASRYGHMVAVMCIDLDRFKQVNDQHGHAAGDACLQEVAARLLERMRESDTVARSGGEEFTVVIGEMLYREDAETVARDLLEEFRRPFLIGDLSLQLSASIGIALYPHDGTEGTRLMRSADLAMYRAKYSGGDRYSLVAEDGTMIIQDTRPPRIYKSTQL